jgi:hypothetical protein
MATVNLSPLAGIFPIIPGVKIKKRINAEMKTVK